MQTALLFPLLLSLTPSERVQLYSEHAHANASQPDALIAQLEAELGHPDALSAPLCILWTDAIARYGSPDTKARARAAWSAAREIPIEQGAAYPLLVAGTVYVPQVSAETLSELVDLARQGPENGISAWACEMPAREGREDRLRQELCEGSNPSTPGGAASGGIAPDPALDIDACLNVALINGEASENLEAAAEACAGSMDAAANASELPSAADMNRTPDGLKIAPYLIPIVAAGIGAVAVVTVAVITQIWEDKRQAAEWMHQADVQARARAEREAEREADRAAREAERAPAPPPQEEAPQEEASACDCACENTCTEDNPEGGSAAGARAMSSECAAFSDAFKLEAAREVGDLDFSNPHMDPRKALLDPSKVAPGEDMEMCGMDSTTLRTESDACGAVDCNSSGLALREVQACCGTHAAVTDHARASCVATSHCSPEDPSCCDKAGRVPVPPVRDPNGPSPVPEMSNERPNGRNGAPGHPGRPDRP